MFSSTVSAGQQALAAHYNNLRKDIITTAGNYVTTTGSTNAYILTIDSQYTAYTPGDRIVFKASFTNTDSATVNVNGIGVKTFKKGASDLQGFDITNGNIYEAIYDGTYFQLLGVINDGEIKKSFVTGENFTEDDTHYIDYNGTTYKFVGLESSFTQVTGVTLSGTGTTGYAKIKMIDTNTIIVVWVSSGSTTISAIAGTINATTGAFTWGTAVTITTASAASYFDVEKISTGKFVVVNEISGNASARVCTVSGTTITVGTAANIGAAVGRLNSVELSVCEIGTDKFAVLRNITGPLIQLTVCTVSGTTITVGTAVTYADTTVTTMKIIKLGTDKFIACYDVASSIMKIRPCTVATRTITLGTLTTAASSSVSLTVFDGYQVATDLVILGGKNGSSTFLSAVMISVSGTVGTIQTFYTFGAVAVTGVRAGDLNPNTLYLIENPLNGTTAGTDTAPVYFIAINQTTYKLTLIKKISMEVNEQLRNTGKWKDNAFIQAKLGSDVLSNFQLGYKNNNIDNIIGKVKSSGSSGNTAQYEIIGQVLSGYSGLSKGMYYYMSTSGTLNFDTDGKFMGLAISATELLYF